MKTDEDLSTPPTGKAARRLHHRARRAEQDMEPSTALSPHEVDQVVRVLGSLQRNVTGANRTPAATLDPQLCRVGRALLGWSQAQLSEASGVNKRTIMDCEAGARQTQEETLRGLREAMERAGVVFLEDEGNLRLGPGVRLKDGAS